MCRRTLSVIAFDYHLIKIRSYCELGARFNPKFTVFKCCQNNQTVNVNDSVFPIQDVKHGRLSTLAKFNFSKAFGFKYIKNH